MQRLTEIDIPEMTPQEEIDATRNYQWRDRLSDPRGLWNCETNPPALTLRRANYTEGNFPVGYHLLNARPWEIGTLRYKQSLPTDPASELDLVDSVIGIYGVTYPDRRVFRNRSGQWDDTITEMRERALGPDCKRGFPENQSVSKGLAREPDFDAVATTLEHIWKDEIRDVDGLTQRLEEEAGLGVDMTALHLGLNLFVENLNPDSQVPDERLAWTHRWGTDLTLHSIKARQGTQNQIITTTPISATNINRLSNLPAPYVAGVVPATLEFVYELPDAIPPNHRFPLNVLAKYVTSLSDALERTRTDREDVAGLMSANAEVLNESAELITALLHEYRKPAVLDRTLERNRFVSGGEAATRYADIMDQIRQAGGSGRSRAHNVIIGAVREDMER